jgi:hypothetical protein
MAGHQRQGHVRPTGSELIMLKRIRLPFGGLGTDIGTGAPHDAPPVVRHH